MSEVIAPNLSTMRGFIFDVDGTLALADKGLNGYAPLPGSLELLDLLRSRDLPYVVFTNGSLKTPMQLSQALAKAGIQVAPELALTPPAIAVSVFRDKGYKKILVLGAEGVWKPLVDAGFEVVCAPERADDADAVFIGWYPEFGLADLDAACRAIWQGAGFYTVSTVPYIASRDGRTLGISGALTAAISSVTDKEAIVVGKPAAEAFATARALLNVAPEHVAIVGDDPALENEMAHLNGAVSVSVHTGLYKADDFARLPQNRQPHYSLSGIDKLLELLQ
ncbi:MAG: haloacid dehalogenase [Pusillimonas sp.]|nr:haloacid dehalogenase [Pusillimonas sp.]